MQEFNPEELKKLYIPPADSHKGQNGKLLLIGGSHLFHAASLWALKVASRIVDMVFYSSVPENNEIVKQAKQEFRDGIVIPREQLDSYINETDCVLIGPGMVRSAKQNISNSKPEISSLDEVSKLEDEWEQTRALTKYLLEKYPEKKWVIDAGALQMMEPEWLKGLGGNVVLSPHTREFAMLFGKEATEENIVQMAKEYNVIIVVKGEKDFVATPLGCRHISGGNPGMTKGGTGDVLAGLIAALACKNDLFLAAQAGSYINKKAGDSLYERVGPYFNASDLVDEIPKVMKQYILS